jgi:hypothetical protein
LDKGESFAMKNIPRTGKQHRPKTAIKGKRYLCEARDR